MREQGTLQVVFVVMVLALMLFFAGCNRHFAGGFYNGLASPYQPMSMHNYMIGDRFYSCQTFGMMTQCY